MNWFEELKVYTVESLFERFKDGFIGQEELDIELQILNVMEG